MDQQQRLLSLDIFRGITIAGMILVNNPGSWEEVYAPLLHADWHGVTPTDWIFPFFIFIVGVAIAYAVGKRKEQGDHKTLVRKIIKRTLIIFGIGLFLNGFPYFNLGTIRIPGVLQRIALVYGATSMLFLYLDPRQLFWVGVGCLLGYWALMTLVPVPGVGTPNLEPSTNLGAWLDRTIMNGHLWSQSKTWDPEGLLSTLPAIGTGISGVLAGLWLRKPSDGYEKAAGLLAVGVILLSLACVWDLVFPINKKIWTSSYVLYTSGAALLFLGAVYWLVDLKGYKGWTKPFVVYGTNALFVFVMSGIVAKLLYTIKWTNAAGETITAKTWLWESVYEPAFASVKFASFAFAMTNVLFFLALSWVLYAKKIFIKV
ncbi:acyltransferase family protein [Lewinella sp. LCG006]|uniref:acyltransferase family protein n=1 Tax=Lewinella sp. LCG006 TaxID=3231911 RepID=UPI003460C917